MHRCITAPIRWTLLLCCHSPRLPTDWLSPPPPSWSSYMSSAASLDCVSHSTSHLTHKQHTTKQVLWFFNPPSLYPLFNTNRNSVWCFAASCLQKKKKNVLTTLLLVFHCGFPGAKLTVSWFTLTPGLFPHLILAGLVCVFHFHLPTNHCHTSPVDKAIHSAAQHIPAVHIGNEQRQAQKEKGWRETDGDFYFPCNESCSVV